MDFSIREVKGQLRIVQEEVTQSSSRDLPTVEASIASLQEKVESWRTAQGATLSEKCAALRERLKEQIEIFEYAKIHELPMDPIYGDLTERLELCEAMRDLSDEEFRAKMLQEAKDALERLSK